MAKFLEALASTGYPVRCVTLDPPTSRHVFAGLFVNAVSTHLIPESDSKKCPSCLLSKRAPLDVEGVCRFACVRATRFA